MVARLIILTGKHQGKKMALAEGCKLVVGRDEGVAVRLATSEVSRRHCVIRVRSGVTSVEDLGSRNGTQIDDVTITKRTRLRPGNILRVGPMLFEFEDRSAASGNAASKTASDADVVVVKNTTEDSIVNWLGEDEPVGADTDTVIGKPRPARTGSKDGDSSLSIDLQPPAAQSGSDIPPPSRLEFSSIAEEAEDIIRRHLIMKQRN